MDARIAREPAEIPSELIPEVAPGRLKRDLDDAHTLAVDAVAAIVGVDPRVGLTTADALGRAAEVGSNALVAPDPPKVWRLVLQSAAQPFVLLLLVAGVAAALIGEVRDGLLILAGLLPLVAADVATEYRGETGAPGAAGGIGAACPGQSRRASR